MNTRRRSAAVTLALAGAVALSACTVNNSSDTSAGGTAPKGRVPITVTVSSEKIALLNELARTFNDDKATSTFNDASGAKKRAFVTITKKASGAAAQALATGWNESTDGPFPTVWSPAARSWGAILNQRLGTSGAAAMAPDDAPSFMLTPLVIAMPKPMASALGWPKTPIGYGDLLALAKDPTGWASKGHPEWGTFKLGKTNPNFSTSGLSATIAQYYAATGKRSGLTLEDLNRPEVQDYAKAVESSVVHYGDITMTFLNNWFRADRRGTALTYASAVAVEEKSLIDYNMGNPDGILDPGEVARKPRVPLVAIYPKEGTLFSDNPLFTLNAPWVTAEQKAGAAAFAAFVRTPTNQKRVLEFGFRPGNAAVAVAAPIVAANGVDPNEPKAALDVPAPKVLVTLLDKWAEQRKGARVLFVIDVSGSMGEAADDASSDTKLDLAKRATVAALDEFKADDEIGLTIFSTDVGGLGIDTVEVIPIGAASANREPMAEAVRNLTPVQGTPLYSTATAALQKMKENLDPKRINAVVLLTDGRNEDLNPNDDADQLEALLSAGRAGSEGRLQSPVRLFPIAYGKDADLATLKRIAEATDAAAYDASDPASIEKVLVAVVSNF